MAMYKKIEKKIDTRKVIPENTLPIYRLSETPTGKPATLDEMPAPLRDEVNGDDRMEVEMLENQESVALHRRGANEPWFVRVRHHGRMMALTQTGVPAPLRNTVLRERPANDSGSPREPISKRLARRTGVQTPF